MVLVFSSSLYTVLSFCLAMLSALYVLPVLPKGRRLRDLPWLKAPYLAFIWAMLTVWPLLLESDKYPADVWAVLAERSLFVCLLIFILDWRDRHFDQSQGLKTWANTRSPSAWLRGLMQGLFLWSVLIFTLYAWPVVLGFWALAILTFFWLIISIPKLKSMSIGIALESMVYLLLKRFGFIWRGSFFNLL